MSHLNNTARGWIHRGACPFSHPHITLAHILFYLTSTLTHILTFVIVYITHTKTTLSFSTSLITLRSSYILHCNTWHAHGTLHCTSIPHALIIISTTLFDWNTIRLFFDQFPRPEHPIWLANLQWHKHPSLSAHKLRHGSKIRLCVFFFYVL